MIYRSGQKGFTLIELLVVVSIMGMLASVVLLNVTRHAGAGKSEVLALEHEKMVSAVSAYYSNNGSLPPDTKTLVDQNYIYAEPTLADYRMDGATGKVIQLPKQ